MTIENREPGFERLIFCDIDGCLNKGKNIPFKLDILAEIGSLLPRLADRGIGFTLCTGRPQPFAEAVAQILACDLPLVCEGGAMVYVPDRDEYRAMAEPATLESISALRTAIANSGLLTEDLFFEIGKAYSLCITGPFIARRDHDGIRAVMEDFRTRYADYAVNWSHSTTSIDITPSGTNKGSGVSAVSSEHGVALADTIGIGDTNGDLSMLELVGQACCPANASAEVKQISDYISAMDYADGTLDILKSILNRA